MSPEEHDVVLGSGLMWLATGSDEPVAAST